MCPHGHGHGGGYHEDHEHSDPEHTESEHGNASEQDNYQHTDVSTLSEHADSNHEFSPGHGEFSAGHGEFSAGNHEYNGDDNHNYISHEQNEDHNGLHNHENDNFVGHNIEHGSSIYEGTGFSSGLENNDISSGISTGLDTSIYSSDTGSSDLGSPFGGGSGSGISSYPSGHHHQFSEIGTGGSLTGHGHSGIGSDGGIHTGIEGTGDVDYSDHHLEADYNFDSDIYGHRRADKENGTQNSTTPTTEKTTDFSSKPDVPGFPNFFNKTEPSAVFGLASLFGSSPLSRNPEPNATNPFSFPSSQFGGSNKKDTGPTQPFGFPSIFGP